MSLGPKKTPWSSKWHHTPWHESMQSRGRWHVRCGDLQTAKGTMRFNDTMVSGGVRTLSHIISIVKCNLIHSTTSSFFIVRGRIQSCSFSSISHPDLPVAMQTFKEVSKERNPQFRNTIEGFIKYLSSGHLHGIESNSKRKFQNSNPCMEPIYLPFSLEKSATLERWQRWREKVHRTWLRGDTNSRLAQFTTYAVIKSCTCTFYALSLGRGISS